MILQQSLFQTIFQVYLELVEKRVEEQGHLMKDSLALVKVEQFLVLDMVELVEVVMTMMEN